MMELNQENIHEHFRWKAAECLTDMLFDRLNVTPSTSLRYGVIVKFNEVFNGKTVLDTEFFDDLGDYLFTENFLIDPNDAEFIVNTASGMQAYSEIVWTELQRFVGV